jgi:hypothetical protein
LGEWALIILIPAGGPHAELVWQNIDSSFSLRMFGNLKSPYCCSHVYRDIYPVKKGKEGKKLSKNCD